SFDELLHVFFTIHDPTTLNRQGGDVGTQYRSAIFYHSPEQEATAERVMAELRAGKVWDDPIVTELKPLAAFYPAEEYHRDYFRRNPNQGYSSAVIAPKVAKVRKLYLDKLKQPTASAASRTGDTHAALRDPLPAAGDTGSERRPRGAAGGLDGAVRGGVLLQGSLGFRRRVHPAVQEEPFSGPEAPDRARPRAAGHRGGTTLSRHRGRPLGLSRDDRVEERGGAARSVSRRGAQASVPRPGHLPARGAAALRDPRGALGPAGGQCRPDAAVA